MRICFCKYPDPAKILNTDPFPVLIFLVICPTIVRFFTLIKLRRKMLCNKVLLIHTEHTEQCHHFIFTVFKWGIIRLGDSGEYFF